MASCRLENVPVPAPDDPAVTGYDPFVLSYFWALLQKTSGRALERTRFAPQWALTRAILDATYDEVRSRDLPFLLVYIPASRPHLSEVPEAAEGVLTRWAAERGVEMLNLRLEFLKLPTDQRDGLYAGHWTAAGHRIAAERIAERVSERLSEPLEP